MKKSVSTVVSDPDALAELFGREVTIEEAYNFVTMLEDLHNKKDVYDIVLPNGKKFKDSTFKEVGEVGAILAKLDKKGEDPR
jgi:hypothetical protein